MQNHIRNTNLRFNLDKDQQRRAWEYLQTMDRQNFKSYSQVISLALVDYFDRYYRTQADPYLETREREELFVKQIVEAVEHSLKQSLPIFLSGLTRDKLRAEKEARQSVANSLEQDAAAYLDILQDIIRELDAQSETVDYYIPGVTVQSKGITF